VITKICREFIVYFERILVPTCTFLLAKKKYEDKTILINFLQ